ncbi:MAG: hypothetical protein J5589_12445 [Firmicutes bacterium]|nr:hypothetical protein [Bacillota bacterium]
MKKVFAIILVAAMICTLTACTKKNVETVTEEETENTIVGGWTKPDSTEVTDEIRELVAKATEKLLGAEYTPIAFIGSQLVAGMNYKVLCAITPVTPNATAHYAVVVIYKDLEGNVEITSIMDSEAEVLAGEGMLGGWTMPETTDVTDEAKAALEKATEKLVGAEYAPVALLATQLVSGTNYCLLCEVTAVAPGAEANYVIVHVCQDLNGNAEVTETFDLVAAE